MIEIVDVMVKSAEIKRLKNSVPNAVDVNVKITRVEGKGIDTVVLGYAYTLDYKPEVARVVITGNAHCRETQDTIQKLITEFTKKKSVPMDVVGPAINVINATVGMNVVFLLRPFNLLPPFMPPPLITTELLEERQKEEAKTAEKPAKKKTKKK